MEQAGKRYTLTWRGGLVVAADSTAATDSVGRIALRAGLLNAAQLGDALRIMTTSARPQIEVLAEIAKLQPDQVATLKQALLAHRAARSFALSDAEITLDDTPTMPVDEDVPGLDCRWLIYNGVRAYYTAERLESELAAFRGASFQLLPEAAPTLGVYGFGPADKPFLAAMHAAPTTVDSLVAAFPAIERTTILAAVYALASTNCVDHIAGGDAAAKAADPTPEQEPVVPAAAREPVTAKPASDRDSAVYESSPQQRRSSQKYKAVVSPRVRGTIGGRASQTPDSIRAIIDEKLAAMGSKADHFELLGVSQGAAAHEITSAYFSLAKKLHPDRLRAAGVDDRDKQAHRLFAHINDAFDTLTNPKKRVEYMKVLAAGGEDVIRAEQADAERLAAKMFGAEDAFLRGQMALRHQQYRTALEEFTKAVELIPEEGEHHAMFAWATWCASADKESVVKQVKSSFKRAIALSPKNVAAFLYRGRVAQQRGQDETAVECFKKVLELEPNHKDAELELRLLEKRQEKESKSRGLFSRLKRS